MLLNEFRPRKNLQPGQVVSAYAKPSDQEKLIAFILKNSSEFLSQCGKKPLFRGFSNAATFMKPSSDASVSVSNAFIANPRLDRQPTSSDPAAQTAIDKQLAASGFIARRGNSIYCTGKLLDASSYGKAYFIFPLNGFAFTWNYKIDDLYVKWPIEPKKIEEYQAGDRILPKDQEILNDIFGAPNREFSTKYGFTNKDLAQAIVSGHEICISGNYLAVDYAKNSDLLARIFFK